MKFNPDTDYYQLLEVPSNADTAALREAFRLKARQLHPDTNPAPDAATRFQEVTEAYNILSDPHLRRRYDQARWQAQVEQRKAAAGSPPQEQVSVSPAARAAARRRWNGLALWLGLIPVLLVILLIIMGILISLNINPIEEEAPALQQLPSLAPAPTATLPGDQSPVTENAAWQPIIASYNGVEMVYVPAGCTLIGPPPRTAEARQQQRVCFGTAEGAHPPFWIDRYEVSNALYRQLDPEGILSARGSRWVEDDRPRESITWEEAAAFCALRGMRLPSSAEWQYAARGPESWPYPWGEVFEADRVVFRDNSDNESAPVGSIPAGESWVGAYDLLGNVWEWVADSPQGAGTQALYGGSAHNNSLDLIQPRIARGQLVQPDQYFGFRCAY